MGLSSHSRRDDALRLLRSNSTAARSATGSAWAAVAESAGMDTGPITRPKCGHDRWWGNQSGSIQRGYRGGVAAQRPASGRAV